MKICLECNQPILTQGKKFCSPRCFHNNRKGKKFSKERREKIANALRGTPLTEERKQKISIANTKNIPIDILEKLFDIWSWRYVIHFEAIKFHLNNSNFCLSERVYRRLYNKYKNQYSFIKFLPVDIQKWPQNKMNQLITDLQTFATRNIIDKYQLGKKIIRHLLKGFDIKWIPLVPNFKDTKPERIVREFLEQNNIIYSNQFVLGRYRFDFKVNKLLIEVQGDYWHCNPQVYLEPISRIQKKNLINDARKYSFARMNNFNIWYVWEYDLKNNKEEVLNKLLERIVNEKE